MTNLFVANRIYNQSLGLILRNIRNMISGNQTFNQNKMWSIQILRFVAVVLVTLAHAVDSAQKVKTSLPLLGYGYLENFGAIGLDIFFVISGFIITQTAFLRAEISAVDFFIHRIIRIVPIYYLLSFPWAFISINNLGFYITTFISTFLFWPAMLDRIVTPYMFVGWTLCFEMLFYFGVTISKIHRHMWVIPLSLFIICSLLRDIFKVPFIYFVGNPIILEFLFGVIIALLWNRGQLKHPKTGVLSIVIVVFYLIFLLNYGYGNISEAHYTLDTSLSLTRVRLFGVPAALFTICLLQLEHKLQVLPLKLIVLIGDASYSIYLSHSMIIRVIETLLINNYNQLIRLNGDIWVIMLLTISILIGIFIHKAIELPLLKSLRNMASKK